MIIGSLIHEGAKASWVKGAVCVPLDVFGPWSRIDLWLAQESLASSGLKGHTPVHASGPDKPRLS